MYFDSHAHYDDSAFNEDRDELLSSLPSFDVCGIVNAGCDIKSSLNCLKLAEKYPFIYSAIGIHPENCEGFEEDFEEKLAELSKHEKCVAIGEVGLDYHYTRSNAELQKTLFRKQIRLANDLNLPVVIHERDAFADCLQILKEERPKKGVMHCFSGNEETVKLILNLGLYIGIGGTITFKNNVKTVAMCPLVPDDKILIETDAPYLAPHPMRGKRNNSGYLSYVCEKIGDIKGVSGEKIADITKENAMNFFVI